MGLVIINQMKKEFWHQLMITCLTSGKLLVLYLHPMPPQTEPGMFGYRQKLEEKVLASLQTFRLSSGYLSSRLITKKIFLSYISMRLVRNSFRIAISALSPRQLEK